MSFRKNGLIIITLLALILVVAGCNSEGADNAGEGKGTGKGNELRVAIPAQPTTLDQPISATVATRDAARLMFETLVTTDSNYQVVPMLAESVDVSDDSKTYTFQLRKGVKFHNGKEMTAEDVVASMYRWVEKSSVTGNIFEGAVFEAKDDSTVILQLAKPSSLTLDTMASAKMAAAIMPKEIVEAAPLEGVSEYIGTGPFKFVEWKQDQYIHFTKFDDYQSLEMAADGLSGKKEALVDDVYLEIVNDPSTRLAGLQTGKYDFALNIPYDNYDYLKSNKKLVPITDNYGELILFYNEQKGLASDFKMREAINTALDLEKIMLGTFTTDDLYSMNSGGYMTPIISNWKSDAGKEYYNQNDPEKAKQLLDEIGYTNEELRILTTRDYSHLYNASVIVQEQLTKLGMNAKLVVYDWPTYMEKQANKPEEWDVMMFATATVSTPSQLLSISPTFAGGIADSTTTSLLEALEASSSHEEAKKWWDELQGHAWENHLPVTIIGGYNSLYGATDKVEGVTTFSGPIFWNTKLLK